jgi:hypothetical protein
MISVGMAANVEPIPKPNSVIAAISSHSRSCRRASAELATMTNIAPSISNGRTPRRRTNTAATRLAI